MSRDPDTTRRHSRRTILRSIGATAGIAATAGIGATAGVVGGTEDAGTSHAAFGASGTDDGRVIAIEQGDACAELRPLSGDEPVQELYDYTYPMDRFEGPPGSDGGSYSSEGTVDLQLDDTSILFVYDGPDGLSLVVVHGHVDGEDDAGGAVTFTFAGLPADGEWVVRDDYYREDGELRSDDRWAVEEDPHVVDWLYQPGRTDGGAFRGLGEEFAVAIDPAFNDAAAHADEDDVGPIEHWEVLGGDRESPERLALDLEQPVAIRSGACDDEDVEERDWDEIKEEKKRRKEEFWEELEEWKRDLWGRSTETDEED